LLTDYSIKQLSLRMQERGRERERIRERELREKVIGGA
jgi:hypothetical protein